MLKKIIILFTLLLPSLISCEPDKSVSVFVLAGQSNMRGYTKADPNYLTDYLWSKEIYDTTEYYQGFPNIMCSYFSPTQDSSESSPSIEGEFNKTAVGTGHMSNCFGPELGIAEVLNKVDLHGKKIYLIKYSTGASGFYTDPCWKIDQDGLFNEMVTFVNNNLELIKEEGYKPIIKGLIWNQGESDSRQESYADAYLNNMTDLVTEFRTVFKDYSRNQIAFLDAQLFNGNSDIWPYYQKINNSKKELQTKNPYNYLIDVNSTGLDLKLGDKEHGGGDRYHYTADSMMRLGNEYANIIIKNNLLG